MASAAALPMRILLILLFNAMALIAVAYLLPGINRAYPTGPLLWLCNANAGSSERLSGKFDVAGKAGDDLVPAKYLATPCK